jgi:putative FmdB family regulatory protein
MPIYEIICRACGKTAEVLMVSGNAELLCPHCGSGQTTKLMSATSSLSGRDGQKMPGPKDTTCCGNLPPQAGCAGPGSCCGKSR